MPRHRPLTLNFGSGNGGGPGGPPLDRLPPPHLREQSHPGNPKGPPPLGGPPVVAPNSPNSSHGNSATPMPTPPPSHGHRSQSQGESGPPALYDPFGFKPRLPPQDMLSQKWAYQARHLIRAQQALIAAQGEVLRIEQDLVWTEREMFEKERRMAENGELPEEDDVGGEGVMVEKSEKGKPNRQTQPPRAANANAPSRKYAGEMYMPGQFPSPTGNGPSAGPPMEKMSKSLVPVSSKENVEGGPSAGAAGGKNKPLPLRIGSGGHGGNSGGPQMRHSYHPGMPPIRSNSMTSDSSRDSDAKAVHAAERERMQHAKYRQEYEKIYGSRSSSRGHKFEEMRKTLGGDFGSPASDDEEEEDEGYERYDRYYPGQYTDALNSSKKEKRRPDMLNMKSGPGGGGGGGAGGGSGYVDKWVQGSGGGGGGPPGGRSSRGWM